LLVGGSTGSVISAVRQLAPIWRPGARVVALSADLGDKYLDSVYDDQWVKAQFGPDVLAALRPEGSACRALVGAPTPGRS
jgi:cysteine synthase A